MTILSRTIKLSLFLGTTLYAEYGCIDTSYHLAQLNDPKLPYMATGVDGGPCSCPCSKYCAQYRCSLAQGRCPVCGHYRIPKPLVITRASKEAHERAMPTTGTSYRTPIIFKKNINKQPKAH